MALIIFLVAFFVGASSAIPLLTIAPAPLCAPAVQLSPCIDIIPCNKQLIQPPAFVELPSGLGYFSAAVPIVAATYGNCCAGPCSAVSATCVTGTCGCSDCCSPVVPISSPCACTTLATPVCPNIKGLVKPILL